MNTFPSISDIPLWYVSGNKGEMQAITHNHIEISFISCLLYTSKFVQFRSQVAGEYFYWVVAIIFNIAEIM